MVLLLPPEWGLQRILELFISHYALRAVGPQDVA